MPITPAPYTFNANELLTLGVAAYGAVIATFVLGWDAYKWLAAGPKIDLSASLGNVLIGGDGQRDGRRWVAITACNVGDQPTTIVNLGGMYFDSWWRAYVTKRKSKEAFIINEPSQAQRIPYRFEIGSQWQGLAEETDKIVEMAESGYLFMILYTANQSRGIRVRVRPRKKR